jgi:hypothetical protein
VERADLVTFVRQHRDDHKWRHAVLVVAGSATMPWRPARQWCGCASRESSRIA